MRVDRADPYGLIVYELDRKRARVQEGVHTLTRTRSVINA